MPLVPPTRNAVLKLMFKGLVVWAFLVCPQSVPQSNLPCDPKATLAAQLALRSESLRLETPAALELSALLAAESLSVLPTPDGDHALRADLSLMRPQIKLLPEHKKSINAITSSPDGRWIVTASSDHTAQIRSAADGELQHILGHDHEVSQIIVSPDSKLVATASWYTIGLYDLEDSKELPFISAGDYIMFLAVAKQKLVAVGTAAGIVKIFNATTQKEVTPSFSRKGLSSLALDPEGKLLATATGKLVQVSKVGKVDNPYVFEVQGNVQMIAFKPGQRQLAVASSDGKVQLYDTITMQPKGQPLSLEASVNRMTFSQSGQFLAAADGEGNVLVFAIGDECKALSRLPRQSSLTSMTFAANDSMLVTASLDHTVGFYATFTGRQAIALVREGPIVSIAAANATVPIVAIASGNFVTIVKIDNDSNITRLQDQRSVSNAAFGSNGKLVVSDGSDVEFFEEGVKNKNHPKPDYPLTGLTYSPDGRFLLMFKQNENTQKVELYDQKKIRPVEVGPSDPDRPLPRSLPIVTASFSSDGTMLAIAGNSSQQETQERDEQAYVQVLNSATLKKIGGLNTRPGKAQVVAISPNREFVVLGTSEEAYVIPLGQTSLPDLLQGQSITAITFSPDGKFIALGSDSHSRDGRERHTVEVFATADGTPIYGPVYLETAVTDLVFADDNRTLASLTSAKVAYVFDVKSPKNIEINRFPAVDIKAFAFEGRRLVTLIVDERGPFRQTHYLYWKDLIRQACSVLTHKNLSRQEWETYMGTSDYKTLCDDHPE